MVCGAKAMTTSEQAYQDTMDRFIAKWSTTIPVHPVIYPDVPLDTAAQACIDTGTEAWARVTYKPNLRSQTSIAGPTKAKYTAEGIVIIEVYTPTGDGGQLNRSLTTLVETAYEGVSTPNGVWYRNVHTEGPVPDGPWSKSNVYAEWSYDEVR